MNCTKHINYYVQQKEQKDVYAEESKAYNLLSEGNKDKFICIHPIFNNNTFIPHTIPKLMNNKIKIGLRVTHNSPSYRGSPKCNFSSFINFSKFTYIGLLKMASYTR